jgi:hypothetical protein
LREVGRQLITSAFLSRVHGDAWQFAHRSFQEYFYARKFFRWEYESDGIGTFAVVHPPIWQFIADMALRRWDERKARRWIVPEVARGHDPTLTKTTLRAAAAYWLLKKQSKEFPLTGVMLDSVDLTETDFAGRDLTGADLHSSDLSRSNLSHAILRNCDLVEVRFRDCEITRADFRGAIFSSRALEELEDCLGYDSAIFDSARKVSIGFGRLKPVQDSP